MTCAKHTAWRPFTRLVCGCGSAGRRAGISTTGGPEVVVTRKKGPLFGLDEKTFAPIKDEDTQMCAGMALSVIYPAKLVTVRKPDGAWEIVY
jgi:hypothetical protein